MELFGIKIEPRNIPPLDEKFIPIYAFNKAYSVGADKPIRIAVERGEQIATFNARIYGTPDMRAADEFYIKRLIKTLLWVKGGYKIYTDNAKVYDIVKSSFARGGEREFDAKFMSEVYERPFETVLTDDIPAFRDTAKKIGGHTNGCRIGFDAGGSDRKVSAVIDGKAVFTEEVVWYPKLNSDPSYHYDGIVSALSSAAAHLPRVDAVGISSAGVMINDRAMKASLFIKVDEKRYDKEVKDIYLRAVRDLFGPVPCSVINDGDVSALAGAMSLDRNSVLGIAMGTSEAGGFVDDSGRITGWLNELAFVPVDASLDATLDEWSGDIGCGAKYFSQDAVIKLAPAAGMELNGSSPAENLKIVQKAMEEGSKAAADIYRTIGTYLGHTLAFYYDLYHCKNVLLLGRVMSGKGGDLILSTAKEVLKEYPEVYGKTEPRLPDEKFRRLGQSVTAASLPELKE